MTALLACLDFKLVSNDERNARIVAASIIRTHFTVSAEQPVNIEARIRLTLCEAFEELEKQDMSPPGNFFDEVIVQLSTLIAQDSFGRFLLSGELQKNYFDILNFVRIVFKKLPDEDVYYKLLVSSKSWSPAKALMPDITLVEKKHSGRGTILIRNCGLNRIMKMLLNARSYPDWIPDFDEVDDDQSFDYGSCFGVTRLKTSKMGALSLCVVRLSCNFFGTSIVWQTCMNSACEMAGCFFVDYDGNHNCVKVSFVATLAKTKMSPAQLVQSVLLGMLLAVGGQCEGHDANDTLLERDFSFLRRI